MKRAIVCTTQVPFMHGGGELLATNLVRALNARSWQAEIVTVPFKWYPPEQHPDRTRLFMQWKQMDWPVLMDPYNLLGVTKVPSILFIDESGIIRQIRPPREELEGFLDQTYPSENRPTQTPTQLPDWQVPAP